MDKRTNEVSLEIDSEIDNKFVLLQFASEEGKYEEGKTVGIKLCGGFSSEDQLMGFADNLYSKGQTHFKMEMQPMGKWIAFPDYSLDDRENKGEFINAEATGFQGDTFNLNQMYKEREKNKNEQELLENTKRDTIKQSTYFYEPETKEDLQYLISLIIEALKKRHTDFLFYKNVINYTQEKYKEAPESIIEENNEQINEDNDYLSLTANPPCNQTIALFSFANSSSKQKTKDGSFSFKFRGVYSSQSELDTRKVQLQKEDSKFDIYQFPVGEWVAFNSMSPEKANSELNIIIGKEIKKQIRTKKEFETRVKTCKESKGDVKEPVLTKDEHKKNIDIAYSYIKNIKKDAKEYVDMLEKNLVSWKAKFPGETLDDEVSESILDIQKELIKIVD
jgi:Family of unknown function (DUF5832)